jgi:hypothetical protein
LKYIYKDKKSKRIHKTVGIKDDRRIRFHRMHMRLGLPDPDPLVDVFIRIQIRDAQKHVDPVDPDPEHCQNVVTMSLFEHFLKVLCLY